MKKNYLFYSFIVIIAFSSTIDLIKEKNKFSDLENRTLKTTVKFTANKFFQGDFSKEYESYVSDQFIMRDKFINLKSFSESVLGKIENNDILIGKNDFLFQKLFNIDQKRIDNNIKFINEFRENYKGNLSFMLIPNSYEIYSENLIGNPPQVDQENEIKKIYLSLNSINNVNIIDELKKNKGEEVFYRTDHHWTINGVYIAYKKFIQSLGYNPVDIRDKKIEVSDFYGTYYSKAKPLNIKSDIFSYIDIDNLEMEIHDEKYSSIYELEKLKTRDKYGVFIKGNNPYTKIKNKINKNGKKILLIKDSFANSMIPFLASNFEEIHLIDFRSFGVSFNEWLKDKEFDEILILYNFMNFASDGNLIKIKL